METENLLHVFLKSQSEQIYLKQILQGRLTKKDFKKRYLNIYAFMKDFFSKYDQIRSKLWIWSHSLKESLTESFSFIQGNSYRHNPV